MKRMGYWSDRVLRPWSIGVMEYWSNERTGVLEQWSIGVLKELEYWSNGVLEC